MAAPVYRAMQADPRVEYYFTASEEPARISEIYHEARGVRLIHPRRAALIRFDVYIASDFMWATLLRDTARIQIFHGVGGKYGFDAPDRSMREWRRLFFVNERRLRNFVARGAVDAGSPAIRLVGMPKADCLVDGTFRRDHVLQALGLDPSKRTVLYAPTWSPASSLNAMGVELLAALGRMPVNVIMKLHDRSRDLRPRYSGGVDWAAKLQPLLVPGRGALAPGHDISPYLVAADLMVTDHSSAGFEFLLRDRPLVRIHRPQLIELASIHRDYVALLATVSRSVDDLPGAVAAVEQGLADPGAQSGERRRVAADLFYKPGGATSRSVRELYDVLELEPAPAVRDSIRGGDAKLWPQSA
jgi:CDP-glycerol glycerophosphotransferase (TagB/SpsB family)